MKKLAFLHVVVMALVVPAAAFAVTPLEPVVVLEPFVSTGSELRVLNAAPDAGPVDVYVAQFLEVENAEYGEVSAPVAVSSAGFSVRVYRTGETENPLVETGITKGRSTRPKLKVGICGEHGGEPNSVEFCHLVGMDYVSCSPFRVPIARLAAAQAQINFPRK